MKKYLIIFVCALSAFVLSSCGVGSYTVSSGVEDKASVCFVANDSYDITVNIDGKSFDTKTVKDKEYKTRRNIKQTTKCALPVDTGTHTISVVNKDGETVFSKKIVVSTGETKIIKL